MISNERFKVHAHELSAVNHWPALHVALINAGRCNEEHRGDGGRAEPRLYSRRSREIAMKSAAFPGSSDPTSSRPRTAAEPRVAIRSASRAVSNRPPSIDGAAASRASNIACRASAIRWLPSLLADPSTPRPSRTPAAK